MGCHGITFKLLTKSASLFAKYLYNAAALAKFLIGSARMRIPSVFAPCSLKQRKVIFKIFVISKTTQSHNNIRFTLQHFSLRIQSFCILPRPLRVFEWKEKSETSSLRIKNNRKVCIVDLIEIIFTTSKLTVEKKRQFTIRPFFMAFFSRTKVFQAFCKALILRRMCNVGLMEEIKEVNRIWRPQMTLRKILKF